MQIQDAPSSPTVILGILFGFLVVSLIGMYIGEQMLAATNISDDRYMLPGEYTWNESGGSGTLVVPPGVTAINLALVGGGGAGGLASNDTATGGAGGDASAPVFGLVRVVPGNSYPYTIGTGGTVGGASGMNTSITIEGVTYYGGGGNGGAQGGSADVNGSSGVEGYIGAFEVVPVSGNGTGDVIFPEGSGDWMTMFKSFITNLNINIKVPIGGKPVPTPTPSPHVPPTPPRPVVQRTINPHSPHYHEVR